MFCGTNKVKPIIEYGTEGVYCGLLNILAFYCRTIVVTVVAATAAAATGEIVVLD